MTNHTTLTARLAAAFRRYSPTKISLYISTLVLALVTSTFISAPAAQAQGVTADTILIGQSAALTGPAQELGLEMKAGADAYFNYVNENGGVNGRKIKLISLDHGYEPVRAKANTEKLINNEKVLALFGYVGTPTSNAALPLFTEGKVPFIGAFTGAQSLRDPQNRYIFNIRGSYFDETEKIVDFLVRQGVEKISVFYQDDAYGKAGLAGVELAMKKRIMQIAATATVERNTVNVDAAVKKLAAVDSTAVIMIGAYKSCAAFISEMSRADLTRESLIIAMENLGTVDVGGFTVKYSTENHNGSSFVELTIISKDQKFKR